MGSLSAQMKCAFSLESSIPASLVRRRSVKSGLFTQSTQGGWLGIEYRARLCIFSNPILRVTPGWAQGAWIRAIVRSFLSLFADKTVRNVHTSCCVSIKICVCVSPSPSLSLPLPLSLSLSLSPYISPSTHTEYGPVESSTRPPTHRAIFLSTVRAVFLRSICAVFSTQECVTVRSLCSHIQRKDPNCLRLFRNYSQR